MKISCQSCAAKYTIADEKVVGKVIKIKCKKCSSTIVVNGNDPGVLAQAQAAEGGGYDDQAATQLVQQPMAFGGGQEPPPNPDEWTVSVSDDDQRTMTTAQVLTEYAKGTLSADTYLWKDGMADWLPIQQVEELAPLLAASAGQAATPMAAPASYGGHQNGGSYPPQQPAAHAYGGGGAFEGTMPMVAAQQAATPTPAAGAARRAGGRQGVDLFGGGREDVARPSSGGGMAGGMAAGGLGVGGTQLTDKHVGERNETSVLFSLKDLAAAEAAAAKPQTKTTAGSRNDRVDDIFGLGSVQAVPMLAPPSLNTPFIEPPPPPPPPSMAPIAATAGPIAYMPPPKRSPVPFIVGGLGGLALIGSIIFFVMAGGKDTSSADKDKGKTEESKEAKSDKTDKQETTSTATTSTATTTETAANTAETSTVASAGPSAETTSTSKTGPVAVVDPKKDPKKEDPKKEEPKKEEPKKEDPPDTGKGGDAPFDRGAASAAMSGAAGRASGCKKADGPTGSTKVQVTFQPSGKGTAPSVGAPFAGTPTGSCIAGAFKGLSIPPFSGAPVPVSKTVSIR